MGLTAWMTSGVSYPIPFDPDSGDVVSGNSGQEEESLLLPIIMFFTFKKSHADSSEQNHS